MSLAGVTWWRIDVGTVVGVEGFGEEAAVGLQA